MFISYIMFPLLFLSVVLFQSPLSFAEKTNPQQNNPLQFYLNDLKKEGQNIHRQNYNKVVYRKICPYVKNLQALEKQAEVAPKERQVFWQEVIKIYDQAFEFSSVHYLMYCIYNYYKSEEPPAEIQKITQRFLSSQKQEKFNNMWDLCHQEEREGNGDSLSDREDNSDLISFEDYKSLKPSQRLRYIKQTKKAYLTFELKAKKESAQAGSPSPSKKKVALWPGYMFINFAFAVPRGHCLVGGQVRPLVYSETLGRHACPTFGKSCGEGDNFQCGPVFNDKCVKRAPTRSLSERCYQSTKDEKIDLKKYREYKSSFDDILNNYCKGRRATWSSCKTFKNRIKNINTHFLSLPPPESHAKEISDKLKKDSDWTAEDAEVLADSRTEAGTMGSEKCESRPNKVIAEVQELKEVSESEFMNFFLDTAFDNAQCECKTGNDACTRGCLPPNQIPKGASPPILQCKGSKPIGASTTKCMRHVNGVIMSTIHQKLAIYCQEGISPTKRTDYYACISEDSRSPKKLDSIPIEDRTICAHGFSLPHALCGLNLDGMGDETVFDKIDDKSNRRECKAWNAHNSQLAQFPIVKDGKIKKVPLFKKIDPSKMAQYQKDASQIPEGAIVVMKSNNTSGHIEIKTNKDKCGPEDSLSACFCSDYCEPRGDFGDDGFEVQAVFQWNPEIIEYARQNQ